MCFERLNSDTRGPRVLSPPGEHLFSSFCPELTLQEQPRWIQLSPNGFWAAAVTFTAKWLCTNAPTWCVSGFVSVFTLATQLDLNLGKFETSFFLFMKKCASVPNHLSSVGGTAPKPPPPYPVLVLNQTCYVSNLTIILVFYYYFLFFLICVGNGPWRGVRKSRGGEEI